MHKISGILEILDPRSKIISFLAIISCIILTPITRFKDFELYFLVLLAIVLLSRITPGQIVKKMSILIPCIFFIAMFVPFVKEGFVCWSMKIGYWKLEITNRGALAFLNIVVKSSLSFLLLIIASSTTTFSNFIKGLELFRLPRFLILLVSFIHRCLFVYLYKAAQQLEVSYRWFIGSQYRVPSRVLGFVAGMLRTRTHERLEKRYESTANRRFQKEIPRVIDFKISSLDIVFVTCIITSLLCIASGLVYKIECVQRRNAHIWCRF